MQTKRRGLQFYTRLCYPLHVPAASPDSNTVLLSTCLEVAVPMWQERLRDRPANWLQARGQELAPILYGPGGEHLFFKGSKEGDTARVFNALAESLGILSFVPGGVRFLGRRWEARHLHGGLVASDFEDLLSAAAELGKERTEG